MICHMCHKPGHKIPHCPLRKDSNNDGYFRKSVKSLSLSKSNFIGAVRLKKPPNVLYGRLNDKPTVLVVDTGADICVFNKLFVEDHQYIGTYAEAISFDGTPTTYPLAEVKCSVGSHGFVLKGIVVDMPPEEGGLIGYNVDTSTMKALLDLAEQHALRSDTSLNIKLTRSETRKEAHQESIRLEALAAVEQPQPKDPSFYPDSCDYNFCEAPENADGQLSESTIKSRISSDEEE